MDEHGNVVRAGPLPHRVQTLVVDTDHGSVRFSESQPQLFGQLEADGAAPQVLLERFRAAFRETPLQVQREIVPSGEVSHGERGESAGLRRFPATVVDRVLAPDDPVPSPVERQAAVPRDVHEQADTDGIHHAQHLVGVDVGVEVVVRVDDGEARAGRYMGGMLQQGDGAIGIERGEPHQPPPRTAAISGDSAARWAMACRRSAAADASG